MRVTLMPGPLPRNPPTRFKQSEGRKLMSTDAIVLLKTDHKDIREQFRRFQQAGENAAAAKGRIVEKIIELLTVHTYLDKRGDASRGAQAATGPGGRRVGVLRGAPRCRSVGR